MQVKVEVSVSLDILFAQNYSTSNLLEHGIVHCICIKQQI